jgi:mannose-6-phosphate isomerase
MAKDQQAQDSRTYARKLLEQKQPEPGAVLESSCHPGLLTGAPGPWKMANPVREYDWGSTGALAALQGREPSGRPEAELWMGAHPLAPSRLRQPDGSEVSLAAAVHADPLAVLGRECMTRFGARLPFLVKVLAVARALSIQVHPSQAQAAAGFAREQAAGIPPTARSYVDPYAKPEMLLPVTEFVALAGLRRRDRVMQMLASLNVPALRPVLLTLKSEAGQAGPARALAMLATWPRAQRSALATWICEGAHGLLGGTAASLDPDEQSSLEWVITLAGQHPDDPLVVAPLLLRLHRLQPGQAMYLPNGVPHAYLSGVGLEIMASSDNVVRGGLTSKRVDSQGLADLLDPGAAPSLAVPRMTLSPHEVRWQPPVPEFALSRVVVSSVPVTLSRELSNSVGPEVLLCLNGQVTVTSDGGDVSLRGGQSAFLSVSASPTVLAGRGQVYRAAVGRDSPGSPERHRPEPERLSSHTPGR